MITNTSAVTPPDYDIQVGELTEISALEEPPHEKEVPEDIENQIFPTIFEVDKLFGSETIREQLKELTHGNAEIQFQFKPEVHDETLNLLVFVDVVEEDAILTNQILIEVQNFDKNKNNSSNAIILKTNGIFKEKIGSESFVQKVILPIFETVLKFSEEASGNYQNIFKKIKNTRIFLNDNGQELDMNMEMQV